MFVRFEFFKTCSNRRNSAQVDVVVQNMFATTENTTTENALICVNQYQNYIENNTCVTECKSGFHFNKFYVDDCSDYAYTLYNDNGMVECANRCPYYLYKNQCVQNCSYYVYVDLYENICEDSCLYTTDGNNCITPLQMQSGAYIQYSVNGAQHAVSTCKQMNKFVGFNGTCVYSCQNKVYAVVNNDYVCVDNCLVYNYTVNMDDVQYCMNRCSDFGYNLQNNKCVQKCDSQTFYVDWVTNEKICVDDCSHSGLDYYFIANKITQCTEFVSNFYNLTNNQQTQYCRNVNMYALPNQTCTDSCPSSYNFNEGMYDDYCVKSCINTRKSISAVNKKKCVVCFGVFGSKIMNGESVCEPNYWVGVIVGIVLLILGCGITAYCLVRNWRRIQRKKLDAKIKPVAMKTGQEDILNDL